MDFTETKSKDNNNNNSILIAPNESLDTQIENLINSNNFESRINIAFNHLNQIINLTNTEDEIINLSASLPENDSPQSVSNVINLDGDHYETSGTTSASLFSNFKTNPTTDDTLLISTTPSSTTTPTLTKLTNRFNYKCKYCTTTTFSTKIKAHIIEHMQLTHRICCTECPHISCRKQFKDEWKLKRHLQSNRDHGEIPGIVSLYDVMKQHVFITPHRIGFPCPFCKINSSFTTLNEMTDCTNLFGDKNPDDYLYFSTYEALKTHCLEIHRDFNIDGYFICKQCGQIFQSRYKLSCHLFNVHSGKRKNRNKKKLQPELKFDVKTKLDENSIDFHMTSVIESVANSFLNSRASLPSLEIKIKCVVCQKNFKRIRDLTSHVKIMHKSLTISQHQEQDKIINQHETELKLKSQTKVLDSSIQQTPNLKHTRTCFVCSKVFKESGVDPKNNSKNSATITTNLNKTFSRHMQIQHGLNERGERLIECPVCEKNFFNRQQMERHMHTHEIWVPAEAAFNSDMEKSKLNDDYFDIKNNMPEYRDKHSILYCHECTECRLFFKSTKVLTVHKKVKHYLRPVYKCCLSHCAVEFSSVGDFLNHAQIHSQKNIVCVRCKVKFSDKNLLRHHMKNVHYNRKLNNPMQTNLNSNKNNSLSKLSTSISLEINTSCSSSASSTTTNEHDSNENHSCPTCRSSFNSRNSLHNHLATHNTSELRLFLCDLCGHSFKTRKDLSRHASLHDSSKHKTCPECGMTFKTSFHLKRHTLTRHSNLRPFKCPHCHMNFARKDKLKQHEAKHVTHPLYQCGQCAKGFYRKEHLKDHEISKHSKEYPFSCEHCHKGFVHAKDLHRHIRVRHLGSNTSQDSKSILNVKNDQIDLCENGVSFKQEVNDVKDLKKVSSNLQKISIVTDTPSIQEQKTQTQQQQQSISKLNTNLTSNDFKSKKISSILKSNLIIQQQKQQQQQSMPQIKPDHVAEALKINNLKPAYLNINQDTFQSTYFQVTGDQPALKTTPLVIETDKNTKGAYLKSFKCHHCSKGFFYENHLRKHILSKHTVTPLFACSLCNQGFSTKSTAKSHVDNSHVVYTCPGCNKSFKNRSHCQRHILSLHSGDFNNGLKETAQPIRKFNDQAKLVDLSAVNMNMLSLISIDQKRKENQSGQTQTINDKNITSTVIDNKINFTSNINKILITKQTNSTDLYSDLIEDYNPNSVSLSHQPNNININEFNINNNRSNSCSSGGFILLNNQSINYNNISNINNLVATSNSNQQFNYANNNKIYINDQSNAIGYHNSHHQQQTDYSSNSSHPLMTSNPGINSSSYSVCSSSANVLPPIKYFRSSDLLQKHIETNSNHYISSSLTGDKVYLNGTEQHQLIDTSNSNHNNSQLLITTSSFN